MTASIRGAYGFRLKYLHHEPMPDDLIELDRGLPEVVVGWRHASTVWDIEEVGEQRFKFGVRGAATFHVDRDPPAILFDLPEAPPPGALIHPLLTVGIAVLARWRGDVTLHAGAFATPEGAWGILGLREAGKSAILAGIASSGHAIVADDLLAIHEGSAWAGPSCVDLRPDTAQRFADARYLGIVGSRPRYRLSTPTPRDIRSPMRGFFLLDWHDDPLVRVERVPTAEWLRWLYRQEYISLVGTPDPRKLLALLGLPCWRVSRPRDWAMTQEAIGRVLEVAAA
ncbi:hypothetical protein BH20GEM1_BH20GEM1_09020 [soil metagenome]